MTFNIRAMQKIYRFILAVGLFTLVSSSFALPPCVGADTSTWNNCYGRWTSTDGDLYEGEFKGGKRNGQGIYYNLANDQWKGYKYIGEWKDDSKNGQGIDYDANGRVSLSGVFKNGAFVKSQTVDPNTFTRIARTSQGDAVVEDERNERQRSQSRLPACPASGYFDNCFGTFKYDSGNKYVGEWKADKLNGQGTFTWTDGEKAIGEFRDGKTNGYIVRYFVNGNQYEGQERDGAKYGQGMFTWTDGDKYVGEYKNDKANGQGTYTFANGNKYVGEWVDGKYGGRGIYYLANGSVSQTGLWSDNSLISSQYVDPASFTRIAKASSTPSAAEIQRLENERKAAQLEEDRKRIEEEKRQIALERQRIESQKGQALPPCQGADTSRWNNCFGTWTFVNGDKSTGEYKDGKRTGQGTFTWADGDKYVGEFKDDKRNGRGIFYLADGSISQSGIWVDGTLGTSQYIDPSSFTRISKGNNTPSVTDAQRLENERKAAQLEEERRKFEEEKRQAALERQRVESQRTQAQIAPDNRRRLALVIGNDNYSSMPRLNNAVNDAKSMSEALRQANFEVMTFNNLDKRRMEEALRNFTGKLGRDDVGLFYFSGHGIQADNRNFLIPVSENVKKTSEVPYEGIDVNRVMDNLKDAKNALNIVVLDACRSSLPDARGGMSRGLTVTDAPQGSIIAYATSPGKTASDGDGGNSPYTKNLIKAMQRKGAKIEDVFKEVRQSVIRDTNGEQTPSETSYLVGDFYFRQ